MELLEDDTFHRRGLSLLWSPAILHLLVGTTPIVTLRQFFGHARQWPEDLPHNNGRTLAVAGLEGFLDLLSPTEAEEWLTGPLRERVISFQQEFEGDGALIFWLPGGASRVTLRETDDSLWWSCTAIHHEQKLEIGRCLFGGAWRDAREIEAPPAKGRVGVYHPRIS